MFSQTSGRWPSRIVTLFIWLGAGFSAMYWGLKLGGAGGAMRGAPVAASAAVQSDPGMVAYLLGARHAASPQRPAVDTAPAPSRFVLTGVVAGHPNRGAALISVDGKPPKPYRVGAQIEPGLVLQSVAPRRAVLAPGADGPAAFTLDLPPPKK